MKHLEFRICSVLVTAIVVGPGLAGDPPAVPQRRTTESVRSSSLAIEAFKIDEGACPQVKGVVDIDEISRLLEPLYLTTLPRFDAWGNPLRYWTSGGDCWVASYGPDGVADDATRPGDDIRYRNGEPAEAGSTITGEFRRVKAIEFVRTAGLAVAAFRIDAGACPVVEGVVTTDEIAHLLEPAYVATVPRFDTWGNPLRYWTSGGDCWVASYGPDGVAADASVQGDDIRVKNGELIGQ